MSSKNKKTPSAKLPARPSRAVSGQPAHPGAPQMSANDRESEFPAPSAKLPALSSSATSGQPAHPGAPEMSGNDRESEISALTPRQQALLPVIALSPSIAQAARDSGVSERTLRRWLDDPAFREQLSLLHEESYDLARRQLQALVPHFISVLAKEAIENPDPSIRIRAARYAMDYAARFRNFDKLSDDVRDLRATLLDGNQTARASAPM